MKSNRRIHWGQSKLTPEQRLEIRDRALTPGANVAGLARIYDIDPSTVRALRDGTGSYHTITVKREVK